MILMILDAFHVIVSIDVALVKIVKFLKQLFV